MGCLNTNQNFDHWFGNIHLSGPCNRECYFCIGQYMMDLDPLNTLNDFPLPNLDKFVDQCLERNINEINLTGTNTDPLLYKHNKDLQMYLDNKIPNLKFGIRTNAVKRDLSDLKLFNKGSITICSFDKKIYQQMMGKGSPPDIDKILAYTKNWTDRKINIVLGPENTNGDLNETLKILTSYSIDKINLREPYGQPHVGNPIILPVDKHIFGNPAYNINETLVTYWDVHYTEVESINLYANGNISYDYPITRGHSENGIVKDQSQFEHGRSQEQWINY